MDHSSTFPTTGDWVQLLEQIDNLVTRSVKHPGPPLSLGKNKQSQRIEDAYDYEESGIIKRNCVVFEPKKKTYLNIRLPHDFPTTNLTTVLLDSSITLQGPRSRPGCLVVLYTLNESQKLWTAQLAPFAEIVGNGERYFSGKDGTITLSVPLKFVAPSRLNLKTRRYRLYVVFFQDEEPHSVSEKLELISRTNKIYSQQRRKKRKADMLPTSPIDTVLEEPPRKRIHYDSSDGEVTNSDEEFPPLQLPILSLQTPSREDETVSSPSNDQSQPSEESSQIGTETQGTEQLSQQLQTRWIGLTQSATEQDDDFLSTLMCSSGVDWLCH